MASIVSNDAARELHVKVSHGSDIRRFRLARADEPAVTLEKLLSALTREYDLNDGTPLHVRYDPPPRNALRRLPSHRSCSTVTVVMHVSCTRTQPPSRCLSLPPRRILILSTCAASHSPPLLRVQFPLTALPHDPPSTIHCLPRG
jgi:hypothetical protein